ncbi:MAG: PD40 domain-containing protein [Deltaproteobacteria bacterium]|nr:PD40 domain-containing protein [Deltaproteobacteria bacterium]
MRWYVIGLALVAGCGRFGFATRIDDGGHDGLADDAGDASPAADAGICHAGAWGTPAAIAGTVTGSEKADPSISTDELELFFDSNRAGGQARAIWRATRPTRADAFSVVGLVPAVDSAMDDTDSDITPDGLTLYFRSNRSGKNTIYVATRVTTSDAFVFQGLLPFSDPASTARSGPSVTGDELTMFYTRNDIDVATATRPDRASTFTFVRQLTEVNVPASDGDPSTTPDGLELFFSSYRNGPAAIFTASRATAADPFSAPVEMPELLGPGSAAGTPDISSDGRTLYYFVDVGGQLDLYTSSRSCP